MEATREDHVVESVPAVVQEHAAPAIWGATEPAAIATRATEVANILADVLRQRDLASSIQGKEYVRVEGWTLLGSLLGVFPRCAWTREIEGGWEARVEAVTQSGAVIGAAEAMCTRSERSWSNRPDFALRSMAQTRATSKALRLPLGFVMSLAGYEATPAEEMDGVTVKPPAAKPEGASSKPAPTWKQPESWNEDAEPGEPLYDPDVLVRWSMWVTEMWRSMGVSESSIERAARDQNSLPVTCPNCRKTCWPRHPDAKPTAPDFKCMDKECGGCWWPGRDGRVGQWYSRSDGGYPYRMPRGDR